MAKRYSVKKLFLIMSSMGILGASQFTLAGGFQLWEQDGASIGNYHAGRAASAEDASTAYYNPAGLVRIHNQQLVVAGDPVLTNIQFRGTVDVNTVGIGDAGSTPATAQGGTFNFIPAFHYAAPLHDKLVLGISVFAPYGTNIRYGTTSFTRYAATTTLLKVIDLSPTLGFAVTDKLSVGIGPDIQRANAEFDLVAGNQLLDDIAQQKMDTYGQNTASDHAYGFHAGVLYQFTPDTRVGLAYFSKIVHVLKGTSLFYGPLANDNLGGTQASDQLRTKVVLPPTTTLSIFHAFNPSWDGMATVSYTQWSIIQNLVLTGVAAVQDNNSSNNVTVTIPTNYRNSWNYSVGGNYHINEKWMLRSGIGYDQSPSNNQDRSLQAPDSDRIAVAVGAHFQATPAWGFDAGWTHVFAMNTRISNTIVVGDQASTVVGSSRASADVYGFQVKWDIV